MVLLKMLKRRDEIKDDILNFIGFDKKILGILFMILALLKSFNLVNISDTAILSYSISGLFFAVSSILPTIPEKRIFYFLGLLCIIVLPFGNEVLFSILSIDSSIYTLWGVAFVFISLSVSEYESYSHNKKEKQLNGLQEANKELVDSFMAQVYENIRIHREYIESLEEEIKKKDNIVDSNKQ